jgi:hypothetical protein
VIGHLRKEITLTTPYPPQPPGYPPGFPPGGYPSGGYPGGGSAIRVNTKFFPLAFLFLLVKPNVTIDGQPAVAAWGNNVFPVAPGQHYVHVHTPYFLPPRVGPADLAVSVGPGQTADLEYKAPLVVWSKGSLGPPPQKYNGAWFLWLMLGILVLILICCCGTALLNNN